MKLTEKHRIYPNHSHFSLFQDYSHRALKLRHRVLYVNRQLLFSGEKTLKFKEMDELLRDEEPIFDDMTQNDYRNIGHAQCAQQIIKHVLDDEWKSFVAKKAKWNKRYKMLPTLPPKALKSKPNPPNYTKNNPYYLLIFTNQSCIFDGNHTISFPKIFKDFTLNTKIASKKGFKKFNQVKVRAHRTYVIFYVIYTVEDSVPLDDNDRYISIDLGVKNIVAVANNICVKPFIIRGSPIVSINQYCQKLIAHFKSIQAHMNPKKKSMEGYALKRKKEVEKAELKEAQASTSPQQDNDNKTTQVVSDTKSQKPKRKKRFKLPKTKKIEFLYAKRDNKIQDFLHKVVAYIINWCIHYHINTIVIGRNKGWKEESDMGKVNNQNFCFIPHSKLIEMIKYKAERLGIAVIETEESYTSGTSFLDFEKPEARKYNNKRRIERGMFVSNNGVNIHADINAAYQILQKAVPDAFRHHMDGRWDRGCVLHPVNVVV